MARSSAFLQVKTEDELWDGAVQTDGGLASWSHGWEIAKDRPKCF